MSNLLVPPAEQHHVDHLLRVVMAELTREHPGHVYSSSMLPPARLHTAALLVTLGFDAIEQGDRVEGDEPRWCVTSDATSVSQAHAHLVLSELATLRRYLDRLLSAPTTAEALADGASRIRFGAKQLLRARMDVAESLTHDAADLDAVPAGADAVHMRAVLAAVRDRIAAQECLS